MIEMLAIFTIGLFVILCMTWFTMMVINMLFDEVKEFKEKLKGKKDNGYIKRNFNIVFSSTVCRFSV